MANRSILKWKNQLISTCLILLISFDLGLAQSTLSEIVSLITDPPPGLLVYGYPTLQKASKGMPRLNTSQRMTLILLNRRGNLPVQTIYLPFGILSPHKAIHSGWPEAYSACAWAVSQTGFKSVKSTDPGQFFLYGWDGKVATISYDVNTHFHRVLVPPMKYVMIKTFSEALIRAASWAQESPTLADPLISVVLAALNGFHSIEPYAWIDWQIQTVFLRQGVQWLIDTVEKQKDWEWQKLLSQEQKKLATKIKASLDTDDPLEEVDWNDFNKLMRSLFLRMRLKWGRLLFSTDLEHFKATEMMEELRESMGLDRDKASDILEERVQPRTEKEMRFFRLTHLFKLIEAIRFIYGSHQVTQVLATFREGFPVNLPSDVLVSSWDQPLWRRFQNRSITEFEVRTLLKIRPGL